jgi:glycosyltransferase involved in cell wall biosynthesis
MRILFDHQTFTHQDYGGISRYFYELATRLATYNDVDVRSSIKFSNNEYIAGNKVLPSATFFKGKRFKGKMRLHLLLNEMYSKKVLRKSDYDIFHPTYYDTYHVALTASKPVVVTCLDMIHEKFIKDDAKTADNKKKLLHRADRILAISENTKKDVVEYYGISPNKISVTYLASSIVAAPGASKDANDKFFLYVGKRNLYKNFAPFVTALAPLLQKHNDVILKCAGGGPWEPEELELVKKLGITDKVKLVGASNADLQRHYSTALAFIFPSLYEGFGIPVLEAMNCGCPVALSDTSSLPEVGGDAAIYFNPYDGNSMLNVFTRLLEDAALRRELVNKGNVQAKLFSWDATARSTHEVYKSLL